MVVTGSESSAQTSAWASARQWVARSWTELWRRVSWTGLLLPLVLFGLLSWAHLRGAITFGAPRLHDLALILIYAVLAVAALRYLAARELFFLLVALLCGAFVLREHHVRYTTKGVFLEMAVLGSYAWFVRARLRPFIDSRLVMTLFAAAGISYYIAWSLDTGKWRRWLPRDNHGGWSPVEESMDVTGTLFLLAGVILAIVMARRLAAGEPYGGRPPEGGGR